MMAILKAKNNTGEWETVADVSAVEVANQLVGEIKQVRIDPIRYNTTNNPNAFDLSPYIEPGDDFCLFFTTSSGVGSIGCTPLVYIKSDGKLRSLHDKNTVQMGSLNDLFPLKSQCDVSYDEENCRFVVDMQEVSDSVHNNAWLFYADFKEA